MKLSEAVIIGAMSLTGAGCSEPKAIPGPPEVQSEAGNNDIDAGTCTNNRGPNPEIILAPKRGEYQGPVAVFDFAQKIKEKPHDCSPEAISRELQKAVRIALADLGENQHIDSIYATCCPHVMNIGIGSTSGEGDSSTLVPVFLDTCEKNTKDDTSKFFGGIKIHYRKKGISL